MMKRVELLSPAGDMERLELAVKFGADAVYVGGTQFGMRSNPSNFDPAQLQAACKLVHAAGKKLYLTCNTLPRSYELDALPDFLRSARAAGELFRAALADCPGDREQELADAEEKKTPSAREKAKNAVLEKYTDAQERLDKAAALLGRVEQLAVAGEWTPLYDLLTPYVLGMEELPGLKGMKKRLNGEHKKVIRTRADEGAALFAQILELIPCSEEEAEADRRAAEPRLRALFAAVRDFDARFSAKKRERKLLEFSDFEHFALSIRPSACSVTRMAPPPRCAGSSGRTTPP